MKKIIKTKEEAKKYFSMFDEFTSKTLFLMFECNIGLKKDINTAFWITMDNYQNILEKRLEPRKYYLKKIKEFFKRKLKILKVLKMNYVVLWTQLSDYGKAFVLTIFIFMLMK